MTEENNYFEEIAPPEERTEEVEVNNNVEMKDDVQILDNQTNSENVEKDPVPEIVKNKESVIVNTNFIKPTTEIRVISLVTGKTEQALATNKNIKLLKDKQYFIPVNTQEDSDEYPTIKIFSDMANLIEVKYVKDGYACIQALINKTVIIDDQRLCILC